MAFLEINGVQKRYATAVAVEHVTLQIERGEFVSFLGPSGCGKTTTLRMVAGFERPTAGTIMLDGVDLTNKPVNKRNIGMVFQSYALFPNMTVAQNIAFGMKLRRAAVPKIEQKVRELLDLIELPDKRTSYPWQLSGGQQQRVALARALAIEPDVLLLDEPLSALDAKIRDSLRNQIRAIQRKLGITTIYVTHDQEEALALSDRVVVMNQGRVEQIGTPFQIYNLPQTTFVASFVGTLNVLSATIADVENCQLMIDGQPVRSARSLGARRNGETVRIALRPEALAIEPNTHDNALRATVEDTIFLGQTVRLRARLGEHTINADVFNSPRIRLPAIGESMTLYFAEESCLILDSAAALEEAA